MELKYFMCLLIVAIIVPDIAKSQMQIRSYDPSRNDRFYVGPEKAFIGEGYDWSGVGMVVNQCEQWATMISPRYFLSSNHYHPEICAIIRFSLTSSFDGPYEDEIVYAGKLVQIMDLRLGELDSQCH